MKEDKYFYEKYITTPAGNRVKALVPKKLSPKEKERVNKRLLEDIKLIALASQRRKSS